MAFSLEGLSDAVLSALSRIGIDLHEHDKDEKQDQTPKLIYDITKQARNEQPNDCNNKNPTNKT